MFPLYIKFNKPLTIHISCAVFFLQKIILVLTICSALSVNLFRVFFSPYQSKLEDRSQKKKIMFLHSKNKASRKGYKGEC